MPGGDENRECKASGVARAILRSGTARGSGEGKPSRTLNGELHGDWRE